MKKIIALLVFTMAFVGLFSMQPYMGVGLGQSVSAQSSGDDQADEIAEDSCDRPILGLPTWFKYLDKNSDCDIVGPRVDDNGATIAPSDYHDVDELPGKFDWQRAAGYVAIAILEILLRVGSLVAVGFVVYGGFRLITSQGDPEGAKNGRNTIINAVIGLVITIASASIVAFIANRLTS